MIPNAIFPWLLCLTVLSAADSAEDLLRFTNGDQLHGTYSGIKDGSQTLWLRDDLPAPVAFKTTRVRHVVLHGGRPLKPLASLSHLGLINGDRLPGNVTAIDDEHITLDTSYAGVLRLPRKQVAMLAPNPLGGRLYYHGPFAENEWTMAHPSFPDGVPAPAKAKDEPAKEDPAPAKDEPAKDEPATDEPATDEEEAETADLPERWYFSGSAWYWKNKRAGTALIRDHGMPDRAVLRFDLAWKNRLSLAIAFHADFARAQPKDEGPKPRVLARGAIGRGFIPGDAADLPRIFGNSYVLQMYSNYMMLYRTRVSEQGKPSIQQVQLNNNNLRLVDTGEAKVEIRSNRLNGAISLFINDEFVAQWSEAEGAAAGDGEGHDAAAGGFAGKGPGFGFVVQGDDSPVRISDVVVSEWNGMPDSARSLQIDDQDVVLMASGTDRYAGRVGGLDEQGNVLFEGKHGQFRFPLQEVAEIRFARERLAIAAEPAEDNLTVRFNPIGSVSGLPVSGDASNLEILSPSAGPLNLSLDSAVMLDFNSSKQIIDDWNAQF